MNDEEKLQYARDNYSIGDKISRKGFGCNIDTVTIKLSSIRKENDPYFLWEYSYILWFMSNILW